MTKPRSKKNYFLYTTGTLYVIKNNDFFQIFLRVANFPLINIKKIITQKYHPKNANHPENYVCHPKFTKFTTLKIKSLKNPFLPHTPSIPKRSCL